MFTARSAPPLLALVLGLCLGSCAIKSRTTLDPPSAPGPQVLEAAQLPVSVQGAARPYLIRFGDQLSLQVAGREDSRLTVIVRQDGRISLPFIGEVEVAGHTIPHLQQKAEEAFAHQFRDPRVFVNVTLMAPQRLYVFGEVSRPGMVQSETPLNIIQLLAMAGGPTNRAQLRNLIILDDLGDGRKQVRMLDITSEEEEDLLRLSLETLDSYDIVIVPPRLISEVGDFVRDYINVFLPPIDTYMRGRYYWKLEGGN
jgi:polysaccharide export outer membrane protein